MEAGPRSSLRLPQDLCDVLRLAAGLCERARAGSIVTTTNDGPRPGPPRCARVLNQHPHNP